MTKNDKIHIKVELFKDKNSGALTIMTHFDQNAPNISKDKEGYSWWPTVEEKDFINEAFDLISTHGIKSYSPEKDILEPPEIKEENPLEIKEDIPEEKSPFEKKDEEKPVDMPPGDLPPMEKKEDETSFEQSDDQPKTDEEMKKEEEEEQILVQADDEAIEAALKKDDEKDETIVEADEQTIIDRVLSQKKKGKWNKGR